MLFRLSMKNIRKSMKDYAVYFFTLILGVAVFYVFNALETQTVLLKVQESTYEIIQIMTDVLSGVSVFVSLVLGFLIIYASRFLMKRRNKEFALYLILGMGKRKISMILFVETILIGLISLVVGIGVGVCLSQVMSALVANLFEADMSEFTFIFSKSACLKTLLYFGIMYIVVMIFNTISISKCKLIDLLTAGRKTEQVRMKNPFVCTVVFLISAVCLGFAYYMVTAEAASVNTHKLFLLIGVGCVSTFFLFWSVSGLMLRIVMSAKKLYFRGLNSFTLRQISSKVNTTVFSMTVICIMLFLTICILSNALSIKISVTANLNELAPVDLQLTKPMNPKGEKRKQYNEKQLKNSGDSIVQVYQKAGVDILPYLKEYVQFYSYKTKELTLKDFLGSEYEKIKQQYPFMIYDSQERIVKLSDYNKVAALYGQETFTLQQDEYIMLADYESIVQIRNQVLKKKEPIRLWGHELKPKYTECQDGFIDISANYSNAGIFVVPDEIADESCIVEDNLVANYAADSKEEKVAVEKKITAVDGKEKDYMWPDGATRIYIVESSNGLGAMTTFIGLYLGIIFLISSAAILALKELSESTDNVNRYQMLRKLGADEKMISKALFRQIGIFFMIPLLLACIHSIFGLRFSAFLLESMGIGQLLPSILATAGVLVLIYGGYFLITYMCSKNIIREK